MNTNRLAGETSPYLLQHAHNPVDWYAWGPEAFERARREDRPIFLSVGYSTCYWCHVMERQSFESEAVAAVLNEHFVSVKVDREERPDVDQLYMTGVQVQTRHGGWPMSVFLTPDLQYFYGGTYFPPDDAYGRPGFVSLLLGIADAWKHRRDEVMGSARQFTRILSQLASESASAAVGVAMTRELIAGIVDGAVDDHDARLGGFGGAPKFPRQTLLELIFAATEEASTVRPLLRNPAGAERALRCTLDAIMYGGIRDQLGGGFHRYSTDAKWLVPHFEIMLYDNAMLGRIYAAAARRWGEARYATVARELFDFVLRALTSPTGAFYTAFDAEVDAREGEPYLWTEAEARSALSHAEPAFSGSEIALFCRVFGLDQGPNFADPHGEHRAPHANVLFVADPEAFHANSPLFDRMRRWLLGVRAARKQPLLDTKVITSWNALMIGAMAEAGTLLEAPRYVAAAARAAEDVLAHHLRPDGTLLRTSRDGRAKTAGFLDDYAGLADALLSLHAATREPRWHAAAERLAAEMRSRFADPAGGALFFTDATADELIVRQKTGTDSPLPAGNALAARVTLRLGDASAAARIIAAFGEPLTRFGEGLAMLACVAESYLRRHDSIAADGSVPAPGLETAVVRASARRDGDHAIEVDVEVTEGFHLHANQAADGYTPTTLNPPSDLTDGSVTIVYPPGRPWRAEFAMEEIPVYSGRFVVRVESGQALPPGRMWLALRFQACDASACRRPETLRVEVA